MERSDTEPIFSSEAFEEFIHNDSFNERFRGNVFVDLLQSPRPLPQIGECFESLTAEDDVHNYYGGIKKGRNNSFKPIESTLFARSGLTKNQLGNDEGELIPPGTISQDNFDVSPESFLTKEDDLLSKVVYVGGCDRNEVDPLPAIKSCNPEISSDNIFVKEESQAFLVISENGESLPQPSLSLEPYRGEVQFQLKIDPDRHSATKWCFNSESRKLYCDLNVAIPVQVCVYTWDDAYINITPVYTSSQHHNKPVRRCHIHKIEDEERNRPFPDHIVHVENCDASHILLGDRHSINVPLGHPAPGETSKTILIRCGCWNTCVGGPNRRPFSIVFTLFDRQGNEIGRQILDLKVCSCPYRDMKTESKKSKGAVETKKKKSVLSDLSSSQKPIKRARSVQDDGYEIIKVPSSFAPDVKRYINQLVAERYLKQNTDVKLPF